MNILILGIGNILFQDEGMGVHAVHYLDEKYSFLSENNSISIVDGGTLAQRLIPEIVKYDEVIIIDCISAKNSKAGDIYFFNFDSFPNDINWQGSAHEVEMLQTLNMIQMQGDLPNTNVLGIIPKRIDDDTSFYLSDEVILSCDLIDKTIIKHLKTLGIHSKIRNKDINITDMAEISYKREIINGPTI